MHVVADDGAVLVRAVVVGGDAAGAVVDALAHRRVTQIGEVVSLRALRQRGVLDLDEVADVHLVAELRTGSQARERPDQRAAANAHAELLAVDVGERMDHRAGTDDRIADHAVRADAHAVGQLDAPFEHAVDVHFDVAAAQQLAAQVEAGRVGQAHARVHQLLGPRALVAPLQLGQLARAVDPQHLGVAARMRGDHRHAVGDGHRDDVGQVVLALRVVVAQAAEPALERRGGRGHHAGVDLADLALRRRRVLVLDDALHRVAIAHDAPVAAGVGQLDGQQRQAFTAAQVHQCARGGGLDQRHVAVENQGRARIVQQRRRLLHRVAGAQLRHLACEAQPGRADCCFDFIGTMTGDDDGALCAETGDRLHHVLQQRSADQPMQYLRLCRFHAGAFARGHDHDVQRHEMVLVQKADYRGPCPAARPAGGLQRRAFCLQPGARSRLLVARALHRFRRCTGAAGAREVAGGARGRGDRLHGTAGRAKDRRVPPGPGARRDRGPGRPVARGGGRVSREDRGP